MVNMRAINRPALKLDLGFNVANNKNKVLSVPNGQFLTNAHGATIMTQNGASANVFFGYKTNGIFESFQCCICFWFEDKEWGMVLSAISRVVM